MHPAIFAPQSGPLNVFWISALPIRSPQVRMWPSRNLTILLPSSLSLTLIVTVYFICGWTSGVSDMLRILRIRDFRDSRKHITMFCGCQSRKPGFRYNGGMKWIHRIYVFSGHSTSWASGRTMSNHLPCSMSLHGRRKAATRSGMSQKRKRDDGSDAFAWAQSRTRMFESPASKSWREQRFHSDKAARHEIPLLVKLSDFGFAKET
jgi:hypothetical protein